MGWLSFVSLRPFLLRSWTDWECVAQKTNAKKVGQVGNFSPISQTLGVKKFWKLSWSPVVKEIINHNYIKPRKTVLGEGEKSERARKLCAFSHTLDVLPPRGSTASFLISPIINPNIKLKCFPKSCEVCWQINQIEEVLESLVRSPLVRNGSRSLRLLDWIRNACLVSEIFWMLYWWYKRKKIFVHL